MNIVNKACNLNNFRSSKAMEHCMTIQIIDKGWYDYCKIGNILSLENKITTGINLFFYIFQTRTVPLEPQIGYDFENSINHIKFRNFQPFIIVVQIFFRVNLILKTSHFLTQSFIAMSIKIAIFCQNTKQKLEIGKTLTLT